MTGCLHSGFDSFAGKICVPNKPPAMPFASTSLSRVSVQCHDFATKHLALQRNVAFSRSQCPARITDGVPAAPWPGQLQLGFPVKLVQFSKALVGFEDDTVFGLVPRCRAQGFASGRVWSSICTPVAVHMMHLLVNF